MIQYGFELEGFAVNSLGEVIIPPASWPTDGFPGLVEIRNTGGGDLYEQFFRLHAEIAKLDGEVDFSRSEYVFSGAEISYMRKHRTFSKDILDVKNLYGKQPRRNGNKTLASFQINVSDRTSSPSKHLRYQENGKAYIHETEASYGLLDVGGIVKRLDDAFAEEIKASNRQKGMYSLKGDRLEYRSLPNTVFTLPSKDILKRIKDAVEPKEI